MKDYKTDDTIKLLVVVSCHVTQRQDLTSPQDRIHKSLIGIPKDLEEINPQAWVRIESKVSYEVTQLRRSVKKEASSLIVFSVWSLLITHYLAEERFEIGPRETNEDRCPYEGHHG